MDEETSIACGQMVLDLVDELLAQANTIRALEARLDTQAGIIQSLINDYGELVTHMKRQTQMLEEIRRRQDDGESWKYGGNGDDDE